MQGLLVLEANEISPKVFSRFAERKSDSAVAAAYRQGRFIETHATDIPEADLYPSQTWASMNTGRPYDDHRTYWYNDEKDYSDFYWHQVASKRKTVLVNTLHSSPLGSYQDEGLFDLVIPDCFAADDDAKPDAFRPFQRLNCELAQRNGRRSSVVETIGSAAKAFIKAPFPGRWGIGARSAADLGKIVVAATMGERERIREAQFPLLADIFVKSVKDRRPGLGVLFTNHVAAMQHRYWYALFPEDYPTALYGRDWVDLHSKAILSAMGLLDEWLGELMRIARDMDYTLLITTSMGQAANTKLTSEATGISRKFVVRNAPALLAALDPGQAYQPELEGAMAPQYTFGYRTAADAAAAKARLDSLRLKGLTARCETSGRKLTLTVAAEAREIQVGNRSLSAAELGFTEIDVDDHHSGRHHPAGSMFVFNDRAGVFDGLKDQIDYLEVAPVIKQAWG